MCDIELDPASVWNETDVRARKRHVCDCCGGHILPGETYTRHFSVCDGVATGEKCCAPCKAARVEFKDVHGTMGTPGYSAQLLMECFGGESRKFWSEDDRRWRVLVAGMIRRGRAAKREAARRA